jgi:succinate-acetate transporter protein
VFAIQVVFAILTLWFGLLAISEFTGSEIVLQMAGFEGLITGAVSVYLGGALLINETTRRNLLPIGEPFMSKIIIPDDISQLFD